MKVAIVFASNLWFAPYIKIYTKLLDAWNVNYEVIYWDRYKEEPERPNVFSYIPDERNLISKYRSYHKFAQFVKERIIANKYDKIIVSGPQTALLLRSFLIKRFKRKYILDYRDLSIEQLPVMKWRYKVLLNNSYANVISSPGFAEYLPKGHEFLISHNFDIDNVNQALETKASPFSVNPIKILTIGGIRDYSSNSEVIRALSNHENIRLEFVGKGSAREPLENLSLEIGADNVSFRGYYDKRDEADIVSNASFINIFYPKIKSHSSALSNRFYNSLIFCRPMVVTKGGIQGYYADRFNVGIAVDSADEILGKVSNWIDNVNFAVYEQSCKRLLSDFLKDYERFKNKLFEFCQ